jgi:hypothetical protein
MIRYQIPFSRSRGLDEAGISWFLTGGMDLLILMGQRESSASSILKRDLLKGAE